jgi:hypothetical protein
MFVRIRAAKSFALPPDDDPCPSPVKHLKWRVGAPFSNVRKAAAGYSLSFIFEN